MTIAYFLHFRVDNARCSIYPKYPCTSYNTGSFHVHDVIRRVGFGNIPRCSLSKTV